MIRGPEQSGEAGARIESRPTQPVDRTCAAHEGCSFPIADMPLTGGLAPEAWHDAYWMAERANRHPAMGAMV
jgi:hypothetical protein